MTKKLPKPNAARAKPRPGIVMPLEGSGYIRGPDAHELPPDPAEDAHIPTRAAAILGQLRLIPTLATDQHGPQDTLTQLAALIEAEGFPHIAAEMRAAVAADRLRSAAIAAIVRQGLPTLEALLDTGAKNRQGQFERWTAHTQTTRAAHFLWKAEANKLRENHPDWPLRQVAKQVKLNLTLRHTIDHIRKHI